MRRSEFADKLSQAAYALESAAIEVREAMRLISGHGSWPRYASEAAAVLDYDIRDLRRKLASAICTAQRGAVEAA